MLNFIYGGTVSTKNKWKKALLILMCVGVALGGTYTYLMTDFKREMISPATWQAFSPQDDRFDIKFPHDPKESHEEVSIANKRIEFHQFSAQHQDAFDAVSYLDFPGHWKLLGSQKLLTKSFEMLMENEPNVEEILQQELTSHNGDPAIVYKIKQGGNEISGKFVISGNTLYRVAATYPLAAAEKAESQSFIGSFEVKS